MAVYNSNTEQQYRAREEVLKLVSITSPTDRPFLTSIGRRNVSNQKVEWTKQALKARSAANKSNAGSTSAPAANQITYRTQEYNYCQIIKNVKWSDESARATSFYGVEDEFEEQMRLASDENLNDVECTLLSENSRTQPLANTGTEGVCGGALTFVTTNVMDAQTASAGSVSPEVFFDLLSLVWKQGGSPNAIFCGAKAANAISTQFGGMVTKEVGSSAETVNHDVLYLKALGNLMRIHPSKDLTKDLLQIETGKWETAWLREPKRVDMGIDGDRIGGHYICEVSLVALAEQANGRLKNLSYTI